MTQSPSWIEEPAAPKKKGALPAWFWWTCGIGCLVVVLVAGGLAIAGFAVGKRMLDPELVRENLAEILPCDVWPQGYEPRGGGFGLETYVITWPGPIPVVTLYRLPGRGDLAGMLDPDAFQNKIGNKDRSSHEVEIQGRMVDAMSFRDIAGQWHVRIDLTGENPPYAVLEVVVELREGEDIAVKGQELAAQFLEPFDVWRGEQ
jgi:hypothetical protein